MKLGVFRAFFGGLGVFVVFLTLSCSDNVAGPPDSYDRTDMFKPQFKSWKVSGQYAEVELSFSVEAFGSGSEPFAIGPVNWTSAVLLEKCTKSSDGKRYKFSEVVEIGELKTVSAGFDWGGKIYLTGEQMAGNEYFNPATNNFAFRVSSRGDIQRP